MSTLESGSPVVSFRRRDGLGVPRSGLFEQLAAPGLIATPVARESSLTDEIAGAIGGATLLASTAIEALSRDKALDERDAELTRQQNEALRQENDRALAGRAAIDSGVVLPGLEAAIAEGAYDEQIGDDPEAFARSLAEAQGGEEFGEAYNETITARLAPQIAQAAQRRRGAVVARARAEQTENIVASARGATDVADIDATIAAVRRVNPSLTEEGATDAVLADLMNHAVAVSETDPRRATEMLKTARMRAGGRLATEQEIAQARYNENARLHANRRVGAIVDEIKMDLAFKRLPFDQIRAKIGKYSEELKGDAYGLNNLVIGEEEQLAADAEREAREATGAAADAATEGVTGALLDNNTAKARDTIKTNRGTVPNRVLFQLSNMVDGEEQAQLRAAAAKEKASEMAVFQQEAQAEADAMWSQGFGGLIPEFRKKYSDCDEFSVARNARIDETAKRNLARVAQETAAAGGGRAEILDKQIQMVSKNAYLPPAWEHLVRSAGTSLSVSAIATSDGEVQITETTEAGFELYNELQAKAPGVLDMMELPDRTNRIFTAARELMGIPGVGDNAKMALTNAVAAMDKPGMQLDHIKLATIDQELDLQSNQDFAIARDAAPIAEILVRIGKPPAQAVAQAIEQVSKNRIVVNGWSSRAGNVPPQLKAQFASVGEELIAAYAEKHKDEGIRRRDLAFRYDNRNGLWQIVRESTGLIPDFSDPDEVFFGTEALIERASKVDAKKAETEYRNRILRRDTTAYPFKGWK